MTAYYNILLVRFCKFGFDFLTVILYIQTKVLSELTFSYMLLKENGDRINAILSTFHKKKKTGYFISVKKLSIFLHLTQE